MISLTDKQKEYLLTNLKGIININGKRYFFKKIELDANELVMERLAKAVDIKCAHYERITVNDNIFYLSDDIADNIDDFTIDENGRPRGNGFVSFNELVNGEHQITDIWIEIEQLLPGYEKKIIYEIIKIYLFDILTLNDDRQEANFGINFVNGVPIDVYILDNELALSPIMPTYLKADFFDKPNYDEINEKFLTEYNDDEIIDNVIAYNLQELEVFLNVSSQEFIDLFIEMYDTLTPDLLISIYDELEKKYNTTFENKQANIDLYTLNYEMIGKLLYKFQRK